MKINNFLEKINVEYWILLFFTTCFLIFSLGSYFVILNFFDDKRIYELLLIIICLMILCISSSLRANIVNTFCCFPRTSQHLFFTLAILAILSSLFAVITQYALLEVSLYVGLFLFSLTIASFIFIQPQLTGKILLTIIIGTSVLYQINFFLLYVYSLINDIPLKGTKLFYGFGNRRNFNYYQGWLFFLTPLPLFLYENLTPWLRRLIILITCGGVVLLLTSNSRAALLSLAIGLIIIWIVFKNKAYDFVKKVSVLFLFGIIIFAVLFFVVPFLLTGETLQIRSFESLTMTKDRIFLWHLAITYIKSNPWLGIGGMHYAYYSTTYNSPHNTFLQWGAEFGIPSVLILFILITWGLIAWVKRYHSLTMKVTEQYLWIVLFCSLISGLTQSLFAGVTLTPLSQILMVMLIGWMFGLYFQNTPQQEISTKHNIFTLLLVGITIITLTYTLQPSLIKQLDIMQQESVIIEKKLLYPRFWRQGDISGYQP